MLVTTLMEKKPNWSSGPFAGSSQERDGKMEMKCFIVIGLWSTGSMNQDFNTLFRYNIVQFHDISVSDLDDVGFWN